MIQTKSITYVSATTRALKKWFNFNISQQRYLDINCLETLNNVNSNYQAFLIPLLRKLSLLHKDLMTEDLIDFLKNTNKWEERNPAYFKLIVNDPEKGVFTTQELENLHDNLNLAFSQKKIIQLDYTLAWFFIATGARPVQISRLKFNDINIIQNDVMIKMPLAKGEGIINQGFFLRKSPTILADCLIRYISQSKSKDTDAPLFNLNPTEISARIKNIFKNLDTYSSRLEGKIPVNAYRFRYTLATRALANGASDHEVARLLTHRSLNCIQYYRASMPELQKPIQDALAEEMSFFAHAFKGKIIASLDDAKFKNSAIADFFRLAGKNIGSCGTQAKCYQNAPISCLTCPYFEPLVDAPWKDLLEYLLDDQTNEQEERIKEISIRAIAAVKEIMSLIEDTNS
ncbi:site-specific integrase [Acinetobacter genomosp. 15BJ]|uniref:Site-specific integrase n=1 Tax=Acinetobacter genomosp. 15BJ TaxID=106651 RepID=A0ABT8V5R1_9GAMM|nr:site-specific integrase [Acinetobacter genomosp. 15BJ]MDO3659209.1 site-specific integrase [Acinetobacter genomosp. 15BJ]